MSAERLETLFQTALKDSGVLLIGDGEDIPAGQIHYGKVALADNPPLAASICDAVAQKTKAFPTFNEFVRLPSQNPVKPTPPDENDPAFKPPRSKTYPPELIEKYGLEKIRAVDAGKRYLQSLKDYETRYKSYEELLLQIRTIRASYSLDERGYLDWVLFSLQGRLASFARDFFFTPKSLLIREDDRKKHTFITGGTGSGKSETQKHIIWHYLTKKTDTAIVVLDPHDKLAGEVAKMRPNATSDRLVYVKPGAFKKKYIGLNPFDFVPRDEENLNIAQKHFAAAFEQILGYDLSDAQRAVLLPCIGVMLHREGSTLLDLIRFMDDERNGDLVKYGCQKIPNEQDRIFFRTQFDRENFSPTKQAIAYRLARIVRDPTVRSFLCQESTFDLEKCIEEGKLIVFGFDRSKQDSDVVTTIGQLVNAQLLSYSMRRGADRGKAIHLFADECQYFISSTIKETLGEGRKFGLYLTLATQRTDQVGRELLDAIMGNVACFIVGRNKNKTAEKMAKELQIEPDEVRSLPDLHFFQSGLDQAPTKTKIDYIGKTRGMSWEQWGEVLKSQSEKYYAWETDFETQRATVSNFNDDRPHQGLEASPALLPDEVADLPPIPDVSKRH